MTSRVMRPSIWHVHATAHQLALALGQLTSEAWGLSLCSPDPPSGISQLDLHPSMHAVGDDNQAAPTILL